MEKTKIVSYVYLLLVPIVAVVLGFGVGHVSFAFYLPIWIANVVLMTLASWTLGLKIIRFKDDPYSAFVKTAFFLIVPWILISMFAGLGPPPDTAAEWTATKVEQQIRYFMLVVCGISLTFGFACFREILKTKGDYFYSLIGIMATLIAAPLFIINMLYWGFYLSELFEIKASANMKDFPDWFLPVRQFFGFISLVEVALTYFATFAFVMAMRRVRWIGKTAGWFYVLFSLLGLSVIVLSGFFTESFSIAGFIVSIPAIPFLMPYYIGVNLLSKAGNTDSFAIE